MVPLFTNIPLRRQWAESLALVALLATVLALATWIEAKLGTGAAREIVYHAWWIYLLYGALMVGFVRMSRRTKLRKRGKWGVLVLHYALATILLGALTTHLLGYEGELHIRQGEQTNILTLNDGSTRKLPFTIALEKFTITRHPASEAPAWYESRVRIDNHQNMCISMNNKLTIDNFRIYQSSYDPDERGTILSVNHDPWGSTLSYLGYGLLVVGMVGSAAQRGSRMRTLYGQLDAQS